MVASEREEPVAEVTGDCDDDDGDDLREERIPGEHFDEEWSGHHACDGPGCPHRQEPHEINGDLARRLKDQRSVQRKCGADGNDLCREDRDHVVQMQVESEPDQRDVAKRRASRNREIPDLVIPPDLSQFVQHPTTLIASSSGILHR